MTHGATILDADGLRLTPDEKAIFREADPWGFILFARNIDSADQIRALCGDMREAVGRDAVITIDQEGGRVQRLRPPLGREWAPPLDQAVFAGDRAERIFYLRGRMIAHELRELGIDSNCVPLIDVAQSDTHPFLYNRCYGETPEAVITLGRAMAQAHLDGGVLPVVKHMPGHGRARADSHKELPRVRTALEELSDIDFAPFRALNDMPLGMTAHVVFDALDDSPATLSPAVMEVIRHDIGFDGLIMTDDLGMDALQGSLAEITEGSLRAGCDIALYCNAPLEDRMTVAQAAGRMTAKAQARADRAIAARHDPIPFDIAEAEAELAALDNEMAP
ncbi:beta-N-acetylhexosaminidase [Chachezhania antarctica]|uniref:beta-N-acetylhexosaminidase n=1 Tax=Chachezhania antarctica TaxID=2340860 RepID=UPI000EAC8A24|nr:beta-N-acetylhexosaminidase [Chachezhania antarctica]